MTLFHYTCEHAYPRIMAQRQIVPVTMLVTPERLPLNFPGLVWFTDLKRPNREGLGLSSHVLLCDRLAHRIEVPQSDRICYWPSWRRQHPEHAQVAKMWELAPGVMPGHWWVAEGPVDLPPAPGHE